MIEPCGKITICLSNIFFSPISNKNYCFMLFMNLLNIATVEPSNKKYFNFVKYGINCIKYIEQVEGYW